MTLDRHGIAGMCGHADLLRMLVRDDVRTPRRERERSERLLRAAARLSGLVERDVPGASHLDVSLPAHESTPPAGVESGSARQPTETPSIPVLEPIPFWVVTRIDARVAEPLGVDESPTLGPDDLRPACRPLDAPDLLAWPRLRRNLERLLARPRPGRRADEGFVLDRIARRLPISRVPRATVRRFPAELWLIRDRSDRLLPVWTDQDRLVPRLARLLGQRSVITWTMLDGAESPVSEALEGECPRPPRGAPVLALTDLGAYGSPRDRSAWRRLVRQVERAGHAFHALVPVPRDGVPGFLPDERAAIWDRVPTGGCASDRRAEALTRLLDFVGALVFFEPGLLRAVRLALPHGVADIGTEIEAWQCAAQRHVRGGTLEPEDRSAAMARIEAAARAGRLPTRTLRLVQDVVAHWRRGIHPAVGHEEALALRALLGNLLADQCIREALDDTVAWLQRLAGSLESPSVGDETLESMRRRVLRVWERMPESAREHERLGPLLEQAWRSAAVWNPSRVEQSWRMEQVGESLVFRRADEPAGSLVGWIRAAHPLLRVDLPTGDVPASVRIDRAESIPLAQGPIVISSDRERVHLDTICKPAGVDSIGRSPRGLWMEAGSRDEFIRYRRMNPIVGGASPTSAAWVAKPTLPEWASARLDDHGVALGFTIADLELGPVQHWFRRIPGGRFLMGSPEGENGRNKDETLHEVEVSSFWLGEVPVTEALWQAVTGKQPPASRGGDLPVVSVSWEDCQGMIRALNRLVPGLEARLPTEAEWEFACRAGTTTATYAGDQVLDEDGRAAVLDQIAWYWKNSDRVVRAVGRKRASAFGLRDMLGNVWEWCEDWYGSYPPSAQVDPRGPRSGDDRVLRGGSWSSVARYVRAACRNVFTPGDRNVYFGIRLARGQEARPGVGGGGGGGGGRGIPPRGGGAAAAEARNETAFLRDLRAWRPRRRRGTQCAARPTACPRRGAPLRGGRRPPSPARAPAAASRPELPMTAPVSHPMASSAPPDWASSWGQDRFGVWAGFSVGEVEYRLRWIPGSRFMMGSPPTEQGRSDDETQHEVEVSDFWLGEVPVTQALWEAVTGDNPSQFQSSDRPVDSVSWDDCQRLLEALEARKPGIELRLPTEAEWEYACRAATTTATYAGDIEILGANNAPILDEIAWYGGNSGVGFDLDNGWDSSAWTEKQYDHERAGTRRVGAKRPNAFGLRDMLGNVWEWCEDWYESHPPGGQVDPRGPDRGDDRVLRGGSWFFDARDVRAASRGWSTPGYRGGSFGVRLARGQVR